MADENENENEQPKPPEAPQVPEGYLSQDQVNKIIEQRLARERAQHDARLSELGFSSFDEVAALKKAQAEREKKELEDRQQYKELAEKIRQEKDEELRKRTEEYERLKSQYVGTQAERAILTAATHHGAIAPEQVARLVRDSIRVDDDGQPYVVDRAGNRRTDGKGGDLSVSQFVGEFLQQNPHFQRAADGRGAGGRGSASGGGTLDTFDLERAKRDPDYFLAHQEEIEKRVKRGDLKV